MSSSRALFLFIIIMKKILFWIIWLVLLGVVVFFITKSDTKSAGWYLDRIVKLRQEKQIKLDEIKQIDNKIIEYREIMDWLQYSWLDYLGFQSEQEQPQRTWTETQELINQPIE